MLGLQPRLIGMAGDRGRCVAVAFAVFVAVGDAPPVMLLVTEPQAALTRSNAANATPYIARSTGRDHIRASPFPAHLTGGADHHDSCCLMVPAELPV